ncbi:Stk1 family PASTA domain-containing Ser/Thr kinase [Paenisporosarcina cavernae]|uniref:Serine/threonine-protein kinase PrkC n=1 Tax=Paenisporosarcina cavernae TaxID=2320858 RepID=A0A385YU42_9BACL|nr:Stk1 family PASTA domain-containing Ser/Thr kinase [Paenisporosarcina cavernae]AYC29198.1 Stk1 family PASTA domain-containing Ser/Thr kinase [Paenisporosarcina cavernae]
MLIGKRISDRYKIMEMIGGGGMSNVYLAHDMILDRDVAIKILRYDFSNEEDLHRRFQREALSATSLHHPNIVNIYDVGEDGDLHYLVMEYVKGATLKQFIHENAPISAYESVEIMLQLTSAIEHAHQNQIIHRDIKPQNILMDDHHHVKITDFGIAMALSATSFTQTNSVLGTVHYLSPEQARGGMATKKSDVYALGIVMYELLTGQLPFSGESAVSIALKHLQNETPSVRAVRPEIPQSLENIIMKATAKDPLHRYKTVLEMEADLKTALSADRMNEKPFVLPFDDGATKAMPIIKEPKKAESLTDTKKVPTYNEPEIVPATPKKKKIWPWILGILGFLVVAFLLVLLAFPDLFGPTKLEVPDVKNMTYEEAVAELEDLGFTIGPKSEEPSAELEEGRVIRSIPEAGKIRTEGTKVSLFVSTGKETMAFPSYIGENIDQVMSLLSNQNFESIDTESVFSDEPEGTILQQEPSADEEIIPEETDVLFQVSKGPDLRTVIDLTEYNEKALKDYAKSSGFRINIVEENYSDSIPAGSVISQKPEAGTTVAPGSTIEVVVSKGPQEKATKTYIQTITIPYEPETDGDEQEVKIYIQDQTRSLAEPAEEFTMTEDTQKRLQLVIVEGQDAVYRIVRDNTIIDEQTIAYEDL